ncbi:hypothetical protein BJY01DRAFT_234579 [Aspergillus pseudoustus]|uniref:Dienelactone hydrolase domain-containing protein n=1 Tax=Aspergillus pseudoustus TaxID=1810923 RepID=A0ABR4K2Z3_9EURO
MTCEACRTIPPVIAEGYTPKGESSDIFGNSLQTTQGADILAARLNALVLIPDFFDGDGAKPEWFPTDTEERHGLLMEFVRRKANWTDAAKSVPDVVKAYQGEFPSVQRWGAYGLCWGGKVLALASGQKGAGGLGATVQVHPGLMDKADAEKLTIPHAILASKEELADVVQAYEEIVTANSIGGFVETYESMWHGWMAARADLKGDERSREYTRGWGELTNAG